METISKEVGVTFDINADGQLNKTGWVGKDDALLVRDINKDGLINNATELFGENTKTGGGENAADGFAALADLDSNNDGVFDSQDDTYSELQVWRDLNSDGISQVNELSGLLDAGIESISLDRDVVSEFNQNNKIGLRSSGRIAREIRMMSMMYGLLMMIVKNRH